ncbi:hypothetical protein QBC47DRAFT_362766 [Echria macrotheca]|uniref:Uncharacterized protein n=1 Tax=Echria macrotheca TaxID=438768 RepID=A0AAJ0F994_9PEZI|nr:hypothetical protein QBC47DRAFT_362766 [Echria macrotheca]
MLLGIPTHHHVPPALLFGKVMQWMTHRIESVGQQFMELNAEIAQKRDDLNKERAEIAAEKQRYELRSTALALEEFDLQEKAKALQQERAEFYQSLADHTRMQEAMATIAQLTASVNQNTVAAMQAKSSADQAKTAAEHATTAAEQAKTAADQAKMAMVDIKKSAEEAKTAAVDTKKDVEASRVEATKAELVGTKTAAKQTKSAAGDAATMVAEETNPALEDPKHFVEPSSGSAEFKGFIAGVRQFFIALDPLFVGDKISARDVFRRLRFVHSLADAGERWDAFTQSNASGWFCVRRIIEQGHQAASVSEQQGQAHGGHCKADDQRNKNCVQVRRVQTDGRHRWQFTMVQYAGGDSDDSFDEEVTGSEMGSEREE